MNLLVYMYRLIVLLLIKRYLWDVIRNDMQLKEQRKYSFTFCNFLLYSLKHVCCIDQTVYCWTMNICCIDQTVYRWTMNICCIDQTVYRWTMVICCIDQTVPLNHWYMLYRSHSVPLNHEYMLYRSHSVPLNHGYSGYILLWDRLKHINMNIALCEFNVYKCQLMG